MICLTCHYVAKKRDGLLHAYIVFACLYCIWNMERIQVYAKKPMKIHLLLYAFGGI
jgi:hypothetical protein